MTDANPPTSAAEPDRLAVVSEKVAGRRGGAMRSAGHDAKVAPIERTGNTPPHVPGAGGRARPESF